MVGIPTTSDIFYPRRSFFFFSLYALLHPPLLPLLPFFFQMHDPQHRLCFDKLIDRVSRKRISRIAYSRSTWHSISKKTFHHWHRILTSNNSIFAIPLFVILFFFLFVFTSREIMQKYFNPYYLISYSLFVYLDTRFFSTSREHLANAPAHRSSFLVPNPILFPRSSEKKKKGKKREGKKAREEIFATPNNSAYFPWPRSRVSRVQIEIRRGIDRDATKIPRRKPDGTHWGKPRLAFPYRAPESCIFSRPIWRMAGYSINLRSGESIPPCVPCTSAIFFFFSRVITTFRLELYEIVIRARGKKKRKN